MGDSERKLDFSLVKENRLIRFAVITLLVYLFFSLCFSADGTLLFCIYFDNTILPVIAAHPEENPHAEKVSCIWSIVCNTSVFVHNPLGAGLQRKRAA